MAHAACPMLSWNQETDSVINVRNLQIPYRVLGEGPPLLCSELPLNPFACFGQIQRELARHFQTYVVDLRPAIGQSDRKPPAQDLLNFLSDFSLEVLNQLDLEEVTVLGSFMFGAVAMDIASKSPTRVRALVLLSPTGIVPLPMTPLLRLITGFYRLPGIPFLLRIPVLRALIDWLDFRVTGPLRMREIFLNPETVGVTLTDLYEMYKRPRQATSALALMWLIRNMTYDSLLSRLHEIRCPCLVIHGDQDEWIPCRYVEELNSRLPDSRLVLIPDTKHAPEIEEPELTYSHIERFVQDIEVVQ